MKKLFLLAIAAALVLAACGSGSTTVVATVDGEDITLAEVNDLIEIEGSTIDKEQFAQFLGFQIQWDIVANAAKDAYGIEITEGEIDAEADRIYDVTNADETREEFTANRGVTEDFLRNIAHQGLLDIAVRAELENELEPPTAEQIEIEMNNAISSLTQVCVSHILVNTAEEADDVVARLDAGEEFGAIAGDVSQDPGSGANEGILPCGSAGQYVPEFRDAALVAPIGEVYSEIVESQFGFHIMMVTDREDPDPESVPTEDEVSESLLSQRVGIELERWFNDQIEASSVTVNEEYGTWTVSPPGVTPPSA